MPTITRFNVTPVKSTRLHHPEAIRFETHGVSGDRDFFPITEDGRLFAGSKFGPLVRIEADHDEVRDTLRLRFPDGIDVEGPGARAPPPGRGPPPRDWRAWTGPATATTSGRSPSSRSPRSTSSRVGAG